jgi:Gpi18-like mannosyltransferase
MSTHIEEKPLHTGQLVASEQHIRASAHRAWLLLAIAGSLLLRLGLVDFQSGDYRDFLAVWYEHLLKNGRWHALAGIGEDFRSYCYPPLYLYLISLSTLLPLPKLYAIKLISVSGDYIAAWYIWQLVRRRTSVEGQPVAAVVLFLVLPTVLMNGALWGQCDILYATGLLASLFYILEKRPIATLVAFGLAFSLKPQAIFWCPFLLGLLLTRRIPWKFIWIPPAIYLALGTPAILAGSSIKAALFHWSSFAVNDTTLTMNASNWYQWMSAAHFEVPFFAGTLMAAIASIVFLIYMCKGVRSGFDEGAWLVSCALLSVTFQPFLLPGVHERYFFAADVIAIVYAFYVPRQWVVACLVQVASGFSYLPFLFKQDLVPGWCLAMAMMVALVLVTHWTFQSIPNLRLVQRRRLQ